MIFHRCSCHDSQTLQKKKLNKSQMNGTKISKRWRSLFWRTKNSLNYQNTNMDTFIVGNAMFSSAATGYRSNMTTTRNSSCRRNQKRKIKQYRLFIFGK